MVVAVMMIVTDGGGCDDNSNMVVVEMMVVADCPCLKSCFFSIIYSLQNDRSDVTSLRIGVTLVTAP